MEGSVPILHVIPSVRDQDSDSSFHHFRKMTIFFVLPHGIPGKLSGPLLSRTRVIRTVLSSTLLLVSFLPTTDLLRTLFTQKRGRKRVRSSSSGLTVLH